MYSSKMSVASKAQTYYSIFKELHLTLLLTDHTAFIVKFMSINTGSARLNLA